MELQTMVADHPSISFSKLYTEISHAVEITEYLTASLAKLESRLGGFCNGTNTEIPSGIKESICRELGHQANVSGYLFESIEALAACLCREHPEPDLVGHDLAVQLGHNGKEGGAA
jgi:hypothetical protein